MQVFINGLLGSDPSRDPVFGLCTDAEQEEEDQVEALVRQSPG